MKKKGLILIFLLFFPLFTAWGSDLTVLYTGDMAGNVEPCG